MRRRWAWQVRVGAAVVAVALVLLFAYRRSNTPVAPPETAPSAGTAPTPPRATPRASTGEEIVTPRQATEAAAQNPPTEDALAAAVAEAEQNDDVDAICTVEPYVAMAQGHLLVGPPDDGPPYNGRLVQILDGRAFLPLLTAEWGGDVAHGWLTIPGYRPTEVTWTGVTATARGTCTPNPVRLVPSAATVSGTVVNAAGEPEGHVFVEGCGNQGWTDADGDYSLDVLPGPCVLQAFRRDGLWPATSEPAEITPKDGDDLVVDFRLPPERRGGLGMAVQAVDDGILVDDVIDGGDAAEQGIESGDLVVAIDGDPVVDMTLEEFVGRAVGQEGTEVVVVVRRGAEERTLTLERRSLQ